ncbi:DNA excision repair protein ERCC-1 [Cylas formicarius]|uniref:DNA excision repair protein ERCC-1 n=1 Tax=Cylas formicarius TaxID=197179 RepID=UPI002958AE65|nr:DNA excision repair protein ERCC-1 [Cylas formicarius]
MDLEPEKEQTSETSSSIEKSAKNSHCLYVNSKQRGNPLLKFISNIPWEYSDIVPDYEMGKSTCALFLSLRYHNLNPDYIHQRLKQLGHAYMLRVLLVQVDIKDPHYILKKLTRICILADLTLILAWSAEEAGKIIETYKIYENKPPDNIMGKSESTPYLKLLNALTSIKPINKTDARNLISRFKTLEGIIKATEQQLSECPGLGTRKAKKLYSVFRENFLK